MVDMQLFFNFTYCACATQDRSNAQQIIGFTEDLDLRVLADWLLVCCGGQQRVVRPRGPGGGGASRWVGHRRGGPLFPLRRDG